MTSHARHRIVFFRKQCAIHLALLSILLLLAATAAAQAPSSCGRLTGQQIVFMGDAFSGTVVRAPGSPDNYGVYIMNTSGTGLRRLTSGPARRQYQTPRLSRDGTKVLFASHRIGGTSQIYVMNSDGSGIIDLSRAPAANDDHPVWSPDGRRIAFVRNLYDASGRLDDRSGIYVMNADGSRQTQVGNPRDGTPTWSPDGRKIALTRSGGIYVMNADGTGAIRLTSSPTGDFQPAWSPDGRRIAFTRFGSSGPVLSGFLGDIYIMNADGSAQTSLTRTGGRGSNLNPVWSPDGRKILFTSTRDGDGSQARLYMMNADGSCQTGLARPGGLLSTSEADVK
jgi:TolB protein